MNLLVLGATGATGKQLVTQALAAGHPVRAIVRDPSKLTTTDPRLEVIKGDVTSSAELEAALRGREAVISVLGPRINSDPICPAVAKALVGAMGGAGVKRLVWLSAGGVGDSAAPLTRASFIFGRIIMPLFLRKPYANHLQAEEIIRASTLDWTVIRPVQLVDARTGNAPMACAPGEPPKGLKISREDVARFMLQESGAGKQIRQMPILYA
jgi:uncharacterized protein YbjT (DUF2867 family)